MGSDALNGPGAESATRSLLAAMLLLFAAGAALPALGGLQRWLAHYLALQRLRPLWASLVASVPHVVLGDPPGRVADLLTVRGVDLRLYRRIIEIRDAQWELGLAHAAPAEADTSLTEQARALLQAGALAPAGTPQRAGTARPDGAAQQAGSVVATPDLAPQRRPGHNDPPDAPPALNVS
jgi:hypothetical protein